MPSFTSPPPTVSHSPDSQTSGFQHMALDVLSQAFRILFPSLRLTLTLNNRTIPYKIARHASEKGPEPYPA
jgi:hypothetical protein